MLKPILLLLIICTSTFCTQAQDRGYGRKLIVDENLGVTFNKVAATTNIYDAFKDCSCALDTVNKKILIGAGLKSMFADDYLIFEISPDLTVNAAHRFGGDLIPAHADPANPFPPFVIKRFKIIVDKDPFIDPIKGFLLKYRFKKNHDFGLKREAGLTGYINCHHVSYYAPHPWYPTAKDSLQLLHTFLKDTSYINSLTKAGYTPPKLLGGIDKPWLAALPGYQSTTIAWTKIGKDPVVVIVTGASQSIVGGYVMLWHYYVNAKEQKSGNMTYAKFGNDWLPVKRAD